MTTSIDNFHELNMPNKMLILGEMRELGSESVKEHQKIIDLINKYGLTDVRLIGDEFNAVDTVFPRYKDIESLIKELKDNPISGKTILVKGSNGNHLDRIIEWL